MNKNIFSIVFVFVFGMILVSGCSQKLFDEDKEKIEQIQSVKDKEEITLIPQYPEDFVIFQDYIQVIGGQPRIKDVGIIEATVISITKSDVCPYQEEKCSIQPYPKDIGIVRIDKIIDYKSYFEQTSQRQIEQISNISEGGQTTPEYRGQDLPQKQPTYKSVSVGQEVPTIFILTTGPAQVVYTSIAPTNLSGDGLESEQTVARQISGSEVPPKTYKPIPKQGGYYVFTTKIIQYPQTSARTLPGLNVGNKFRAEILYDGTLYVEEYQIIP